MEEIAKETVIQLLAGQRPDGELVFEQVSAIAKGEDCYQLLLSRVFAKGVAKHDLIRTKMAGQFVVEKHNGYLCVRVFSKTDTKRLHQSMEKSLLLLKAELDHQNERMLVYSIPVDSGFDEIEAVFNTVSKGFEQTQWFYSNVYDPDDGHTPLNWWHDYLAK